MLGIALPDRVKGDHALVYNDRISLYHVFLLLAVGLLFYISYRRALPNPIPGIPHNEAATKHILGDIISLREGFTRTGEFNRWMLEQADKLRSPIFQIFIRPFGRSMVVLADSRAAQDVLTRRKDFDRSFLMAEMVQGSGPHHHIHMKTGPEWKQHRRLLQDLMSPRFLNEVAAPTVYSDATRLVNIWNMKAKIADGRPFYAQGDLFNGTFDAVANFVYGRDFSASAISPTVELLEGLSADDVLRLRTRADASGDGPLEFPEAKCDERIQATFDVAKSIEYLQGSPIPRLKWRLLQLHPSIRRTFEVKIAYVREEISKALRRLQAAGNDGSKARSAIEMILWREMKFAEQEGRQPDFFSGTIIDEIFGFVIAGHDTTSTTMSWGVKLLADHPQTQSTLREALRSAFPGALAENRSPTFEEISGTKIPYLDAAMEEILRCGGAVAFLEREAISDTEVLGHHIPKGTVVMCSIRGPGSLAPALPLHNPISPRDAKPAATATAPVWDDSDIGLFKPERWLVESPSPSVLDFDQHAGPLFAFGLGTRGCFGRRLAYLELRIILVLVVWNFELLPCPAYLSGYAARETLTYQPKDCYVRLSAIGREA